MDEFQYKFEELFNPVLQALHQLGGSGTNTEVEEEIISILHLTDGQVEDIHRGNTSKLSYHLAWARNYLKRLGLIENSARAIWALTAEGQITRELDSEKVKRIVKQLSGVKKIETDIYKEPELMESPWEDELLALLKQIDPSSFERLCQRFLREIGFSNVEVKGKSGDGGIDGNGAIKLGGVLSFYVVFQCKRYSGSVSSGAIRDFRGAMIGRADKGLFITTGTFTQSAKKESQRDGAPPIDLIDGREFAEHLKNLKLGIGVEVYEKVTINRDWFLQI